MLRIRPYLCLLAGHCLGVMIVTGDLLFTHLRVNNMRSPLGIDDVYQKHFPRSLVMSVLPFAPIEEYYSVFECVDAL